MHVIPGKIRLFKIPMCNDLAIDSLTSVRLIHFLRIYEGKVSFWLIPSDSLRKHGKPFTFVVISAGSVCDLSFRVGIGLGTVKQTL